MATSRCVAGFRHRAEASDAVARRPPPTQKENSMRVGFVGAGRMGRPMIARLVDAGHTVRAVARNAEAHAAVTSAGATPVSSSTRAALDAEVLIVCVFSDDQVREICSDTALLADLPAGALIVLHTTGSPETTTSVAAAAARRGIGVVDAPVSGGPHDIAAGTLTVFLGGSDTDARRATEVLRTYADPILHVGELGSGQRVKLVNNVLFAAQIGLVADAVRLATHLGLSEPALLSALPHASSNGNAITRIATHGSVAKFRTTAAEFLRKDIAVADQVATALGANLGLLETAIRAALPPPESI
ncbi:NAD(P)-dependent oxidoreductase [Nocardia sp. NPDC059177]|uniref:NAD(P)-dependent oxidoreductase n=1 Tax=Nocardia sp. NPDC059177 TaxID=3346759 RepID=UPI003678B6FA